MRLTLCGQRLHEVTIYDVGTTVTMRSIGPAPLFVEEAFGASIQTVSDGEITTRTARAYFGNATDEARGFWGRLGDQVKALVLGILTGVAAS